MKQFEYLEHTADAKFRAYGKTLEEAFANAALAAFNILTDITRVQPKIKHEIKIHYKKKESLLYDFLDQLLFLLDTEGFILAKVDKIKITSSELTATVSGDSYKNYDVHGDIKSVTYNDMLIEEKPNKVIVQVVLDI